MSTIVVCALYHFVRLENCAAFRQPLLEIMKQNSIKGTLLLAPEGINGTVAGYREGIDSVITWLTRQEQFKNLSYKESYTDTEPFFRTKVKLKKEIVTMGIEDIDPNNIVGTYVKPEKWNDLISDPNVLLIDTRNDYETGIGTFKGAVNPNTDTFKEFPDYAKQHLNPENHKKVAMFCTGGIRCEKSTAFLKQQGFEEVYHLQGGILKYLEEVPEEESLWEGECFVFDNRVSVNHQLQKGHYDQCYACRMPITEANKTHPHYQQGVSCHLCYDKTSELQKQRYIERQKQIDLAKKRGQEHIGGNMPDILEQNRLEKKTKRRA